MLLYPYVPLYFKCLHFHKSQQVLFLLEKKKLVYMNYRKFAQQMSDQKRLFLLNSYIFHIIISLCIWR